MTDDAPAAIREAFADSDAFAVEETSGTETVAAVTTTAFDATVTARPAGDLNSDRVRNQDPDADSNPDPDPGIAFTVTVEMPTLRAATSSGDVGPALLDGWLDTLERRLADAPKATRERVSLDGFAVETDGDRVVVTYEYTFGDAERGVGVARTFVEYAEGTYVQGVVPGFEYDPPVSDLLREAGGSDDGPGGTPL